MRRQFLFPIAIVVSTAMAPTQSRAEDRYYLIVFASQAEPNLPKDAHTFAVFVKATHRGKEPSKFTIEAHCISWLPMSMTINSLKLLPEPGVNVSLKETLEFAKACKAKVTMWKPFPIQKKCYDMAMKRLEYLNSGKVGFVVLDRRFRGGDATNCIHAISDLDVEQPLLPTGTAHGEAASETVLQHLQKWIVPSKDDLSWLPERLELKKEQIRIAALSVQDKR